MPDVELNFERSEYHARLARVRAAMERAGLDLVIVSDPSNMAWITGYDGWSFYVHQCVLVLPDEDPIWFGRGMDANGARRTVWMEDDRIVGYPDNYVQSTERHPMDYLSGIVLGHGWGAGRIGVEMDNYYFSASCYRSLTEHLPDADFRDATGLVNWERAVKSEREIEYMRRAARIVEAMHASILEAVEPGMRKNDLVAEIYRAAIAGTAEHGGDYPAIVPMLPTGVDASAPHLTWNDSPMVAGDGTFFEIAGCHRRYHCPCSRTVYLGTPPKKWYEAEQALLEGLEAGIEAARAGAICEDIEAALRSALARHGLEKESRCGYSIGLSYPPDWGERTMSFRPGDRSELAANMTFHFMPGLWFDDWGIEITESIVIREGAPAECLANVPRKLFVKE